MFQAFDLCGYMRLYPPVLINDTSHVWSVLIGLLSLPVPTLDMNLFVDESTNSSFLNVFVDFLFW